MQRTSIHPGIYQDPNGGLWFRPTVMGRRTWRRLQSSKLRDALIEAASTDWTKQDLSFQALATLYLGAQCPSATLTSRPHLLTRDTSALKHLLPFFGHLPASSIRLHHLPQYREWRVKRLTRQAPGLRTIELEWVTLSSILNYGVSTGRLDVNYIRSGRPKLRSTSDIRHCRTRAPVDADELHDLAAAQFARRQTEVLGWQLLIEAMSGCRTSEVLRLRIDAQDRQPGHIDGNLLWIARSKHGVNPFVQLHPSLRDTIQAHHAWLSGTSQWWFPDPTDPDRPISPLSLTRNLHRLTAGRLTSHGLRSFYVTTRRSQGATDAQIAAEIGDTTVSLIASTYGDRPPTWWTGAPEMSFLPSRDTRPAWSRSDRPQVQASDDLDNKKPAQKPI